MAGLPLCPDRHILGRQGDWIKMIWWNVQTAWQSATPLEKGRFVRQSVKDGKMALTPAHLAVLFGGATCGCRSALGSTPIETAKLDGVGPQIRLAETACPHRGAQERLHRLFSWNA